MNFCFLTGALLTPRSFLCFTLQRFLWEAWQDLTLIILIVAAVASLALGMYTEVFWGLFTLLIVYISNITEGNVWFNSLKIRLPCQYSVRLIYLLEEQEPDNNSRPNKFKSADISGIILNF